MRNGSGRTALGGAGEPVREDSFRGTARARIARNAGHLLADADRGSEMAVDALVVATAIRLGRGLVVTHDPHDLELLASNHPAVRIVAV
jgi:hypothetical protein